MTMIRASTPTRRRWLSLIVHPCDVTSPSNEKFAVQEAVASGALDLLQLRAMESDSVDDVVTAGAFLAACASEKTPFAINHSSFDVVMRVKATGWHLKERFFTARLIDDMHRQVHDAQNQKILVGCSVHSVDVALRAAECQVDYLQVGTMFSTLSHPEKTTADHLEGPQLLRSIRDVWLDRRDVAMLPPLLAVGGINTEEHVRQVVAAGADGVAVIRGILAASDPHAAAVSYREWLDQI